MDTVLLVALLAMTACLGSAIVWGYGLRRDNGRLRLKAAELHIRIMTLESDVEKSVDTLYAANRSRKRLALAALRNAGADPVRVLEELRKGGGKLSAVEAAGKVLEHEKRQP